MRVSDDGFRLLQHRNGKEVTVAYWERHVLHINEGAFDSFELPHLVDFARAGQAKRYRITKTFATKPIYVDHSALTDSDIEEC